ncbi:2-octaprenyl-3-methyl-6-methoxy-1,4-benzoquinol hydroxylase [Alteromonas pelagimontana]|uniref:2-octaprenyl-3-methyl-6-methoxy-1,4-benzoquinol hydroxylase n=2 Tax=Alteromonas pelagimontana TaxID=1858656 RepID=A0A6M4MHN4_9ALTE|nr:2-octaprenyl-3-methyl-6-methoxy-1,4-benzoquinol hydroxylase [Alteromonas pelagimontana]
MYDFCINGGGMVGAALAAGLVQQGYHVAVIEKAMPQGHSPEQPPDLRVSAINMASVKLLREVGAWTHIQQTRLRAYDKLSVWESPESRTDFSAASVNEPQLGYFVENRLIQLGCYQAAKHAENLSWITGAKIDGCRVVPHSHCEITLDNGHSLTAKWLVGADGARSLVRQQAAIGHSGWQYSQQALGITIELADKVENWTWQEFHSSGPRAFLPMYDNFGSLVWYDDAATITKLKMLAPEALKQEIIRAFPDVLPDFSVIAKAPFALTRSHASEYIRPNVILVGDAAHTINPLAGQGVNLGFKDVNVLLKLTAKMAGTGAEADFQLLKKEYEKPRQRDNLLMMSAMDGFYLLFSNDIPPVKWLRKAMLKFTQHATPAKKQILRYALGMNEWKS